MFNKVYLHFGKLNDFPNDPVHLLQASVHLFTRIRVNVSHSSTRSNYTDRHPNRNEVRSQIILIINNIYFHTCRFIPSVTKGFDRCVSVYRSVEEKNCTEKYS
ncbi:uncharacterized protein LOC143147572 [Ptiloglossa arizonensis]|uniref:uncharacterized protein LOC143147572 n=1 Tax=Ptiloglossa arizonensis TaxID=3350558 RepID=UPI003F9F4D62